MTSLQPVHWLKYLPTTQECFEREDSQDSAMPTVEMRHFIRALELVQPSVSAKDHRSYEKLRKSLRCSRSRITDTSAGTQDDAPQAPTPTADANADGDEEPMEQ